MSGEVHPSFTVDGGGPVTVTLPTPCAAIPVGTLDRWAYRLMDEVIALDKGKRTDADIVQGLLLVIGEIRQAWHSSKSAAPFIKVEGDVMLEDEAEPLQRAAMQVAEQNRKSAVYEDSEVVKAGLNAIGRVPPASGGRNRQTIVRAPGAEMIEVEEATPGNWLDVQNGNEGRLDDLLAARFPKFNRKT